MSSPPIQWYPGHIAKAEQQLRRNLDKVDLVIEVLMVKSVLLNM